MILIGDKNNSSNKIICNESNSYTPIKIGRKDNTASNVIKILIGDKNGIAKEVYFAPLYDWRGPIKNHYYVSDGNTQTEFDSVIEVIAKYSDDLSNRDPKSAHTSVDTFIYNTVYSDNSYYTAGLFDSVLNLESIMSMRKYIPYIKYFEFNHDKEISYIGLGSYSDPYVNNGNNPLYESLEHVVLDKKITMLYNSFTHTPNIKSVFITNMNMDIDDASFTSHYDGCIILWKKYSTLNSVKDKCDKLTSTVSPVLLAYQCIENTPYYVDGLV